MSRVYLIGLPASGKSYTGKWLADKMDWKWHDLDQAIEEKEGMKIPEIFEKKGEDYFREQEKEALKETLKMSKVVISCGGGTAANEEQIAWMNRHGLTLFLNIETEVIAKRLEEMGAKRPMFSGLTGVEIAKKLSELVEKRGKYYHQAKVVWNRDAPSDKLYMAVNQLVNLYPLMA